jgi:hypothetical protein
MHERVKYHHHNCSGHHVSSTERSECWNLALYSLSYNCSLSLLALLGVPATADSDASALRNSESRRRLLTWMPVPSGHGPPTLFGSMGNNTKQKNKKKPILG